jgi:hypothetical protein
VGHEFERDVAGRDGRRAGLVEVVRPARQQFKVVERFDQVVVRAKIRPCILSAVEPRTVNIIMGTCDASRMPPHGRNCWI